MHYKFSPLCWECELFLALCVLWELFHLPTPFQKIFSKPHTHALIGIQLKTGVGSSLQTMKTLSLGSPLLSGTSLYKLQDVLALFIELEIMNTLRIQSMLPYTIIH